jgi:hypothetical protein
VQPKPIRAKGMGGAWWTWGGRGEEGSVSNFQLVKETWG